jgi:hypothetical protein
MCYKPSFSRYLLLDPGELPAQHADDLVCAAEELGIDLSGVRAPVSDAPAQELEGEESSDVAAEAADTAGVEESLEEIPAEDEEDDTVEELDVEELLGEAAALDDDALATDQTPEATP